MPIVNHIVLASGAVVAVSVAVATFIAIYESPELRQYAEDVRRRIALAISSMTDHATPPTGQPRFNRPEDAEGFLQSQAGGGEPGVDADEESRRRQREELLYWNAVRMEKQEKEQLKEAAELSKQPPRLGDVRRGSTFDDFLRPDNSAEHGSYIFNSGADVRDNQDGLRRRGEGRGFMSSVYSNPFADEHHFDSNEFDEDVTRQISPEKNEIMSDIYSATTRDQDDRQTTATLEAEMPLVDLAASSTPYTVQTIERQLDDNEFMSAGQDDRRDAHASIQAWAQASAQGSNHGFYSPLPMTPVAPLSEPEVISEGELTPTDSVSLVGSGEDIASDAHLSEHNVNGRYFDVMSESEGLATPASWSEVGSVISENDGPMHA